MVKASGQIEQELRTLQDKTEVMESNLDPLYEGYIKALSEAGQRQLVMAAYYLCTQAYPDKFLALSWDERNRLQQSLQVLSAQIYDQLSKRREETKKASRRPQNPDGLAFLQRLLEARMAGGARHRKPNEQSLSAEGDLRSPKQEHSTSEIFSAEEAAFIPDAEDFEDDDFDEVLIDEPLDDRAFDLSALAADGEESSKAGETGEAFAGGVDGLNVSDSNQDEDEETFEMEVPAADERLSVDEEEDLLAALEGLARRSMEMREGALSGRDSGVSRDESDEAEEQPLTPIHLVKQQMLMDRAIREVFKTISEEANDLLQKANVMPSFPRSLLAAATEPGGIGEPANAVPNVVRVSVRVMHGEVHGESLLDSEDEREGEAEDRLGRYSSSDDSDDSDSGRTDSGRSSRAESERRDPDRERISDSNRRRSRRSRRDESSMHRRLRKSGQPSRRSRDRRSLRAMSRDAVEIEALPELAAISMRLSEVEFTDPTVSAWRSKLRQKLSDLKQLGLRYKKTQRSLEIAQAEDAWRSSWTARSSDSAE